MSAPEKKLSEATEVWLAGADTESPEQLRLQRFKTSPDNTMIPLSEPWFCKKDTPALTRLSDKWKHAKQPSIIFTVGEKNTSATPQQSGLATQSFWLANTRQQTATKSAGFLCVPALADEIVWTQKLKRAGIKHQAGIEAKPEENQTHRTTPALAVLVSHQELDCLKQGTRLGKLLPRLSHLLIVLACLSLQFFETSTTGLQALQQRVNTLEKQVSALCPANHLPLNTDTAP